MPRPRRKTLTKMVGPATWRKRLRFNIGCRLGASRLTADGDEFPGRGSTTLVAPRPGRRSRKPVYLPQFSYFWESRPDCPLGMQRLYPGRKRVAGLPNLQ